MTICLSSLDSGNEEEELESLEALEPSSDAGCSDFSGSRLRKNQKQAVFYWLTQSLAKVFTLLTF